MTPGTATERPRRPWVDSRVAVWIAFALVHVALIVATLPKNGDILNDVRLYDQWARGGLDLGSWPVLDYQWVYPIGALGPVVWPALIAGSQNAYIAIYLLTIVALDGIALWALLRAGRGRTLAAWWWLAFLLAAGPIAVSRLDGISAALTVIALAALAWPAGTLLATPGRRGALASALATLGAWIKVAPGAAVLAMACTMRRPLRRVIAPAALVSAILIALAQLGGAGGRVLGFASDQSTRGLQIESVPATFFSVARLWNSQIYALFNQPLKTLEIVGPGTQGVSSIANVLLILAVIATCALILVARRRLRGPENNGMLDTPSEAGRLDLILLATMALTLVLFVFNKVGSAQYILWFAPPVAVALAARTRTTSAPESRWVWNVLAVGLLVVAALTQWLYPIAYDQFWIGRPFEIGVGALRNLLTVAFAAMCLVALARWRPQPRSEPEPAAAEETATDAPRQAPAGS